MKYLYKYPQAAYPVRRPRRRPTAAADRGDFEYELLDTGVFDDDRYFDVFVEYAKASPEDILIEITVSNRGPGAGDAARAADDLVPQHLVVGATRRRRGPSLRRIDGASAVAASHPELGERVLRTPTGAGAGSSPRTRPTPSASGAAEPRRPYVKDGINDYVVHGRREAVNPANDGHEGRRALSRSRSTPARRTCIRLRLSEIAVVPSRPDMRRPDVRAPTSTRSWRPAGARRTSSTPRSSRRRSTPMPPT